ncbi:MAG TPA: DUF3618 domain-containing protein [Methylomirabilota bacterium]|nr:DUF3618 domain-containing protein [Methylomirabilota bacterium]
MTNGHDTTWVAETDEETPQSEAIVSEIEATRGAMSETVQAIGDRLSPTNIVADAKATVREATVGKVEEMADSAGRMIGDAGYTAQNAGGSIIETIRRNPVPAAMAALGIGWLVTHKADRQRGGDLSRYGGGTDDRSWPPERSWRDTPSDGPREALADMGDKVGERAGEVGETLKQVPQEVRYRAEGVTQQAGRILDETPLVAGAVAVAVGAVVGAILPSTEMEQRLLGPATEKAIDSAEQVATEKLGEIEQQADKPKAGALS